MDLEKLITRPLEKEINGISGVDAINSTSVEGYSTIQVKFNFDVSPDEALRKVKDKVDAAMGQPDFPTDLPADPNVFELNFSELMPIANINMSGEFSLDQLKEYGEFLEEKLKISLKYPRWISVGLMIKKCGFLSTTKAGEHAARLQ